MTPIQSSNRFLAPKSGTKFSYGDAPRWEGGPPQRPDLKRHCSEAWGTGFAGEHGLVEKDLSRGEAHNYSMEVKI